MPIYGTTRKLAKIAEMARGEVDRTKKMNIIFPIIVFGNNVLKIVKKNIER